MDDYTEEKKSLRKKLNAAKRLAKETLKGKDLQEKLLGINWHLKRMSK